ncbi:MAG: hypothetical protein ACR2Q4_13060 [Geminicoccaceae bacterium]
MNLDKLDAIERATFELAKDLLRTRDRYHPHDPELAAAFSSKVYEICQDFDIDFTLIESMLDSQRGEIPAESIAGVKSGELANTDVEDEESDQALYEILGKQREVVGERFRKKMPEPQKEPTFRLSRVSMSQWFSLLQSA